VLMRYSKSLASREKATGATYAGQCRATGLNSADERKQGSAYQPLLIIAARSMKAM